MTKLLGNDYRLWIESAVAGTYNEIKGGTSTKVNRQAQTIDTSTKDDFPYGTQAPGLKSLTLDSENYPNLPDATGYGRLETVSKGTVPVGFQIRKGGSAGDTDDVVFEASMYVGNFDTDFGKNDVVKSTFQLSLAAAPTIDELK
ncbi:MAG: phage tail tube protein [Sphingobium sp.]|uniref:phage tail tube protein n=1 Tax=Sphingobium sp. TaxID=1912891 RepID=UPI0029B70C58|nr:phage tail tube protein [Sphingobium sp.]MDX3908422.1 phage tail tube protein [Sphingobium sp.]